MTQDELKILVDELKKKIDEVEAANWPKGPVVDLEKPYVDDRGIIQNLVHTKMNGAVLIHSNKGAIRANHLHKTDWHFCYMISGSMNYYHRESGSNVSPEKLSVGAGQLIFTPPLVDHAMEFTTDSTFLTLSRNMRDPLAYEDDLIRIPNLIEVSEVEAIHSELGIKK